MQGRKGIQPKMMYQVTLDNLVAKDDFWRKVSSALDLSFLYKETAPYCKLPQKEYVLKIEKTVTLKRINNEENKIQSSSDCWHFEVL
jgi:hypothetical protein